MPSIFCCADTAPYKSRILDHEPKFREFLSWGGFPKDSSVTTSDSVDESSGFVVQVVRQVNFGPLESKRYFLNTATDAFVDVTEQWLIDRNFEKLDT